LSKCNPMRVETASGMKLASLHVDARGEVGDITVDMGEPIAEPGHMGIAQGDRPVVDLPVETIAGPVTLTCVSMGNPHAVVYTADISVAPFDAVGSALQAHKLFCGGVNVHFVEVKAPDEVKMKTWERGTGPTLACGSGAAAVCVAGVLSDRTGRRIRAHLEGGELTVQWQEKDNHVMLTGSAVEVFSGDWDF